MTTFSCVMTGLICDTTLSKGESDQVHKGSRDTDPISSKNNTRKLKNNKSREITSTTLSQVD